MQNISRHQTKLTPNSEVFELCSQYEALKFQNDEVCGLGERYMWTMKKKVEKIHQVVVIIQLFSFPYSNIMKIFLLKVEL